MTTPQPGILAPLPKHARYLTFTLGETPKIAVALAALREGRLQEAVLRVEDLQRATGLAFLNSLRGWIPAQLSKPHP